MHRGVPRSSNNGTFSGGKAEKPNLRNPPLYSTTLESPSVSSTWSIWDRLEASRNRKAESSTSNQRRIQRSLENNPSTSRTAAPLPPPSKYELRLDDIDQSVQRKRRRGERGPTKNKTEQTGLRKLEALAVRAAVKTAVLTEMQELMDDIIEFFISFHDVHGSQPTIEDARQSSPEIYRKFLRFMELRNFVRREGLKTKMADSRLPSLQGAAIPEERKNPSRNCRDGFHGPVPEGLVMRPKIHDLLDRVGSARPPSTEEELEQARRAGKKMGRPRKEAGRESGHFGGTL